MKKLNFWKVNKETKFDDDCFNVVTEVFIEAPFKDRHDVRLYVNGDFGSDRKKVIYANKVCKTLNNKLT